VLRPGNGIAGDQGKELEQLNTVLEVSVEILDLVVLLHEVGVHPLGEGLLLHIGAVLLLPLHLGFELTGLERATHSKKERKKERIISFRRQEKKKKKKEEKMKKK